MTPPSATFTLGRCMVCGSAEVAQRFLAREMMYGWRHAVSYRECGACGSFQIDQVPQNLAEYYQGGYYSLALPPNRRVVLPGLRRAWARFLLRPTTALADRVARARYRKSPFFVWARLAECGLDAAILDVGCGSGGLLRRMQRYGFSDLTGVDPYTQLEAAEPGFRIIRGDLSNVSGRFNLVMFSHVLEHLADPVAALRQVRALLAPGGRILVRVPVAGSPLCRKYREHWFNLDPPRHLVIPSLRGVGIMAGRADLLVRHVEYDSQETSFLQSENCRNDLSMREAPKPSRAARRQYRCLAEEYNRRGEGDLGVFLLSARADAP